jgi:tRNA U34 5-carboxymethylaminomethyl modifying GTPase MnmE/TrmE
VLTDTAGIRTLQEKATGHDQIESQGINLAREELSKAHGVIFVIDSTQLLKRANAEFELS